MVDAGTPRQRRPTGGPARGLPHALEHSTSLFKLEKWVQTHVGRHPAIFVPLYRLAKGESHQIVSPQTKLVIEGYPRSANSFAVLAFRQAQPKPVRVAAHLHVPAQVILAARWGIPTLVPLREPKDAVISFALRDSISLGQALRYYISFYETIADYRNAYVLGLFDEVTRDFGAVIERINRRFKTQFIPFNHTHENAKRIFARINTVYNRSFVGHASMAQAVSCPTDAKSEAKREISKQLEASRFERLVARAERIHERLANDAHV